MRTTLAGGDPDGKHAVLARVRGGREAFGVRRILALSDWGQGRVFIER